MLCYYLSLFLISVYFVLSDYMFGSGSMEFVVPLADSSTFFPISVCFMATDTFSDLKVCLHFDFNCSYPLSAVFSEQIWEDYHPLMV